MKRSIKKVAVLGSGVMGSRIACHFAGIGVQVLLLDIATPGWEENKLPKNKLVNDALQAAIKSNPSPVYTKNVPGRIATGNFDDNMKDIAGCDWIIEVVVERLDIKQQVYEKVEQFRKPGTLITTNTSGIPIHILSQGRSEDFKKHFCGTHFFNPPRYLRLLEIIPAPETDPSVIDFLMHYGDVFLGKTTVLAKDTPAFIANRVGVFGIMSIFNTMQKFDLSIDEVDALTGPIIGRPKSATFRTADVVGIDTLVKVADGVAQNFPDDEAKDIFKIPAWLQTMIENKWLGDKTGQGFFKKLPPSAKGEKEIYTLNLSSLEYEPRKKVRFAAIESAKLIDDLKTRLKALFTAPDKAGDFYRHFHYALFSYISNRIPEISDELYRIDDAMMAGFGWEIGAFESWDVFGVAETVQVMKEAGYSVASWVDEKLAAGNTAFYKTENNMKLYYDVVSKTYRPVPSAGSFIILENYKNKIVWKNNNAWLYDIGDDVVALQWQTKMNTIGSEVLQAVNKSIEIAEDKFKGLVISNSGANFSAGANVGMIFMYAIEQEYDELDMAIRMFQNTMMRARYSSVPVITAPLGLTLGGGCEMNLHADKVYAAAETYIGLVELGVGLIPGGGGTKEFVLRAADEMHEDEPETITLKNRFLTIATAKVATSAFEGYELGILRKGHDEMVMNPQRRTGEAKNAIIEMYEQGYVQPVKRTDIKVLGRSALGALYAGINGMWRAGYATDHDALVARKLAYVMCGGDLSEQSLVNEQYLLDLEREAFLSLCGEKKTLQRIEAVIKKGKPIRN
ncbi:3-hydroxyacyl-CoA dehydrogenase/enoyl-CoA hydratase family protein [Parafilimonas sp.]|uniref:3-hydroxyacyl-CoA dehydrogenase/enoyl-CoA hydratase family protein n=1 Tax=Parafilimonas sp. TaxID=1969739 RepID=UPI0039E6FC94